jgi:hypothetical protein
MAKVGGMENGIEKENLEMLHKLMSEPDYFYSFLLFFCFVGVAVTVVVLPELQDLYDRYKQENRTVVVWDEMDKSAIAPLRAFNRATKKRPTWETIPPVVPGTLVFAPLIEEWRQGQYEATHHYHLAEGASGTIQDRDKILNGCIITRQPMFVPYVSSKRISWYNQKRLFPTWTFEEAYRRIHGKRPK